MLCKEDEEKIKRFATRRKKNNKNKMILVKTLFDSREFFIIRSVITFLSINH
jgi:hypothetical protein